MKIFAHRGFSGHYPENTMLAFRKAVEFGVDGIELDVHLTRDGYPVIIHDESVDRTTDGTGHIRDYTLNDLRKLDAGCGERIPTLDEYLDFMMDHDYVTNIEIKTDRWYYEEIEKVTVEKVQERNLQKRIIISSFNHNSVLKAREIDDTIEYGFLFESPGIGNAGYFCRSCGVNYYHPDCRTLTEECVRECSERGIGINTWTVNDRGIARKLASWNVRCAITNYPDMLKEILL